MDELASFRNEITTHTLLHEDVKRFYDGFPRDAHPMAMLSSVVSALSTFYQDSHNPFDAQQRNISAIRLLAKVPTIAAYATRSPWASRSSTRATTWATWRTSCG